MESRVTLRPPFGLALTVAVWLVCAASLVLLVATRSVSEDVAYAPWLLLAGYAMWMVFWAPAVVIEDRDVRLRNVARTRVVAWSAIHEVETRYNLTLVTESGSFGAWAAPAPGALSAIRGRQQPAEHLPGSTYGPGRTIGIGDLPHSESGVAAYHVRRGLELRDDGRLPADDGRVVTTWHRAELGVLLAGLCLSMLLTAFAR
ncbi:MAG: PH domain-containing protein [Nocardioidaceae bacterium]|nr:PH domain-containing protein [Nocardioidaceae bacterium]MCL2612239.1 PH domain-containing protein [Nocardioidaceae bacterium]